MSCEILLLDCFFLFTVYTRVKGENFRLVFVVKIHGSPFTREILLE